MAKAPKGEEEAAGLSPLPASQFSNELELLRLFVIRQAYAGDASAFAADFAAFVQGSDTQPSGKKTEASSERLLNAIFGQAEQTLYDLIRKFLLDRIADHFISLGTIGSTDYHDFDLNQLLELAGRCGLIVESDLKNFNATENDIDGVARYLFEYGILKEDEFREILKTRIDAMSTIELKRVAEHAFGTGQSPAEASGAATSPVIQDQIPPKPKRAPRLYAKRPDPDAEDIEKFVQETYGVWLDGQNFTLADLRLLDPQAAAAVDHRRRQGKWSTSIKLPTVSEAYDVLLADPNIEERVRDARRLVRLFDSRKAKPK